MWIFIKRIFGAVWSLLNFTRAAIANLLLVAVIAVVVVALVIDSKPSVPAKSILSIELAGKVVEQASVSGKGTILPPSTACL